MVKILSSAITSACFISIVFITLSILNFVANLNPNNETAKLMDVPGCRF